MDKDNSKPAFKQAVGTNQIVEVRVCPTCGIRLSASISICPNDKTVLLNSDGLGSKLSQQYEIIEEIGSGGMSVIYKARHLALDIMVAIKMLQVNRMDEVGMQRFAQEAKAISLLDHPGIVKVRDYGVTESGQPYMVLDYIDANTLEQSIAWHGPCSLQESLDIFRQAADTLEHAHERGVLHRDIKPSNIMLIKNDDRTALIKIVDFGIAKIIDSTPSAASNLTKTGEVFGSPLYMSPEQASGKKVDQRSDIYSLACTMYETMTGTPPFTGKNPIEILSSQINDDAPTLRDGSLGQEFPTNVEAIINKALRKDPNERFQAMADLKTALEIATSGGDLPVEAWTAEQIEDTSKKQIDALWWRGSVCILTCLLVVGLWWSWQTMHEGPKSNGVLTGVTLAAKPEWDDKVARQAIKDGANKTSLDLGVYEVSDQTLDQFDTCTKTIILEMENTGVKGPGLAHLIHLPLKRLDLDFSELRDRGLIEIQHMSQLEDLSLNDTDISDAGLEYLSSVKSLMFLSLRNNHLSSKGLFNLHRLPNLRLLCFNGNSLSAEGAAEIAKFPVLSSLFLDRVTLDNALLNELKACKRLDTLSLGKTNITARGLAYLAELPRLGSLSLSDCHGLNGLDCAIFKNFKTLCDLNINGIDVSEKTLGELKRTNVFTLFIVHSKISDKGLAILSDNEKLRELHLAKNTNLSKAAIDEFRRKRPNCQIVFEEDQTPL